MTIKQKAREIEQTASFMPYNGRRGIGFEAARLGIIEGLEMAHQRLALVYLTNEGTACDVYLEGLQDASYAIRALIEEQRPLGAEFEAVWDANVERLYEP